MDPVVAAGNLGSATAASEGVDPQLNKYKRLLTLARSSLEANQDSLAKKDAEISELQLALAGLGAKNAKEKARRGRGATEDASGSLDAQRVPRTILCRVDVAENVWVLMEHDSFLHGDVGTGRLPSLQWVAFSSLSALEEYVSRQSGIPLVIPARRLSVEESNRIEYDAAKRVENVVDEFRRFKVKTEIWKKQKEAETRQLLQHGTNLAAGTSSAGIGSATVLGSSIEKALLGTTQAFRDTGFGQTTLEELQTLKQQLAANEQSWKLAYEKVTKDNELLRARGGDVLAAQWRERYDALLREKDELAEKVRILSNIDAATGAPAVNGPSGAPARGAEFSNSEGMQSHRDASELTHRSVEQLYVSLKDEYRDFRRRTASLDQQRQAELGELRKALDECMQRSKVGSSSGNSISGGVSVGHSRGRASTEHSDDSQKLRPEGIVSANLLESKNQYIKQMVLQYLLCREPEVKINIESALIAIFRYSPEERTAIGEARRAELGAAMSSFAGIFSGFPGLK